MNIGKVRLFADDTNLFFSGKSIIEMETQANESLNKLHKWFSANQLTLNTEKTCYSIFSNSKKAPLINISLNGQAIKKLTPQNT
jgi:hypothetical protein